MALKKLTLAILLNLLLSNNLQDPPFEGVLKLEAEGIISVDQERVLVSRDSESLFQGDSTISQLDYCWTSSADENLDNSVCSNNQVFNPNSHLNQQYFSYSSTSMDPGVSSTEEPPTNPYSIYQSFRSSTPNPDHSKYTAHGSEEPSQNPNLYDSGYFDAEPSNFQSFYPDTSVFNQTSSYSHQEIFHTLSSHFPNHANNMHSRVVEWVPQNCSLGVSSTSYINESSQVSQEECFNSFPNHFSARREYQIYNSNTFAYQESRAYFEQTSGYGSFEQSAYPFDNSKSWVCSNIEQRTDQGARVPFFPVSTDYGLGDRGPAVEYQSEKPTKDSFFSCEKRPVVIENSAEKGDNKDPVVNGPLFPYQSISVNYSSQGNPSTSRGNEFPRDWKRRGSVSTSETPEAPKKILKVSKHTEKPGPCPDTNLVVEKNEHGSRESPCLIAKRDEDNFLVCEKTQQTPNNSSIVKDIRSLPCYDDTLLYKIVVQSMEVRTCLKKYAVNLDTLSGTFTISNSSFKKRPTLTTSFNMLPGAETNRKYYHIFVYSENIKDSFLPKKKDKVLELHRLSPLISNEYPHLKDIVTEKSNNLIVLKNTRFLIAFFESNQFLNIHSFFDPILIPFLVSFESINEPSERKNLWAVWNNYISSPNLSKFKALEELVPLNIFRVDYSGICEHRYLTRTPEDDRELLNSKLVTTEADIKTVSEGQRETFSLKNFGLTFQNMPIYTFRDGGLRSRTTISNTVITLTIE